MRKLTLAAKLIALAASANLSATTASLKGIGMGGATVAFPQDSGVMAYNPAGIVDLCNRVDVSPYLIYTSGKAIARDNDLAGVNGTYSSAARYHLSPEVGFVYHLDPKIAVGALLYNEKEVTTVYRRPVPLVGTTDLKFEYVLESFAPTVAVRLPWIQNVSVSLMYFTQRLRINGVQRFDNPLFSSAPGDVTNKGYNYSHGYGVTFGWKADLLNCLSFGIAYKPKTYMQKFNAYKGFVAERGTLDIPMFFRAGVSYTPLSGVTVAFDYQLIRYSRVKALGNHFEPNVTTSDLGEPDGAAFGWKDQHFLRMGIQWDISRCYSVRAGFRHANVPYKGTDVPPNVLTIDTCVDFLTFGGTWLFAENMELTGLYAYGFKHNKKGPIPESPVFGGGTIEMQQQRQVFALSLGWYY